MDITKKADKIANYLYEQFDRVSDGALLPQSVAMRISKLPGHIQYRIWKMIRFLIDCWVIDAQYEQFDPQYREIYLWAEKAKNV